MEDEENEQDLIKKKPVKVGEISVKTIIGE
jgi:hypothetical protein